MKAKVSDEFMTKLRQMNRESLRAIAEAYSRSGIYDKSAIGLILTKIAYGFLMAEEKIEKEGKFE